MAETLALVGVVSSVIQLLDFSSKCVSKTIELCHSGASILGEYAAIQNAAERLLTLRKQVEAEAINRVDTSLLELCDAVEHAGAELSGALAKIKIRGKNTRWKTMRSAIRSVWSRQEVHDLERRLSNLRDEINLHISVKVR